MLALGCGDDSGNGSSKASTAPAASTSPADDAERPGAARKGTTVKLVDSRFGRILADSRGQAVYLFDKETTKRSECYGACAKAWPPLLTKGEPRAGQGARSGLLGTTRRRNGKRQVTYRGHPLYYYVDDGPGRVLCHDVDEFGGLWLVVRAAGTPVS
jgi:predicted lipoprotein with Yx(FWY)xxD motif